MAIIEVTHLTKEYQLGQLTNIKETALNAIRRLTFQPSQTRDRFKALDDVSFTVEEGEVVGIIGHNGAGKSTLLKHLANISKPTKGEVKVHGSVAPLIEVGAGVNPVLTGRENIFLNGAILGIRKKVIQQKLDEIIEFSELEQFIDTPVKYYSSGMKVKLGFSIATSMEADILILDEVLAVGDLAFQRKCFNRMDSLIKKKGKTVLLVSHNIRQVERLCNRTLLLEKGKVIKDGSPSEACQLFYSTSNTKIASQINGRNIRASGEIDLLSISLLNEQGKEVNNIHFRQTITIQFIFKSKVTIKNPEIIFGFHTTDFYYISSLGTLELPSRPDIKKGINIVECKISSLPLMPGVYCIRLGILDSMRTEFFHGETLKVFTISPANIDLTKKSALGVVDIPGIWKFDYQIC